MVIFSYVVSGIAAVLLLYFLLQSRLAPVELPTEQRIVCFGGCMVLLCLGSHWALLIPAGCMAAFAMAHFVGQTSIGKAIGFTALFGVLHAAAYGIAQLFAALFIGLDAVNLQLIRLTALYAIVAVAVLFSRRWQNALLPMWQTIPVWLVATVLCALCVWKRGAIGVPMLQFFSLLWLVYCSVSLLPVSKQIQKRLADAQHQRDAQRQYAMQEEYYRQLQEKQVQTRALWHDLSKYLRAAKAETAPSEALKQLETMLEDATAIVDVGNSVVNVIINEYAQSAKALGIELRLKINVPEKMGISAADLYILIGNTMDNAIEACRALPQSQRFIELTLRTHQDILYYKLANPYDGTTKRPKDAMRGHGLENARRCVAQYDGQLLTQQDQGFFIVSAHMNQRSNDYD